MNFKNIKNYCSLLLAAAVLTTSVPSAVFAEEETQEETVIDSNTDDTASTLETVQAGSIRYISQVTDGANFHQEYWPDSAFGRFSTPRQECLAACISMALSYLGIDKTPKEMLLATNGRVTRDGWGATFKSTDIETGMDKYLNGDNKYSPVLIHLTKYSSNGHYVLLTDELDENTYQVVDPWEHALTTITIDGTNATYTKNGKDYEDVIDQVAHWYLYKAVIEDEESNKKDDELANANDTVTDTPTEIAPPKAPTKLIATAVSASKVSLTWKKQTDADTFKIYQKTVGGSYKYIKKVSKNSCKLNITEGKKYRFKVISYKKNGDQLVKGASAKCEYEPVISASEGTK